MGGKAERERLVERRYNHSLNQKALKRERDRRKTGFGRLDKAMEAHKRRLRLEEQLLEDRRFEHAVEHMFNGVPYPENIKYVVDRIGEFGGALETFKTEKFDIATVIVDVKTNNKV